jgi:molecular chaperone DnaK
MPQIEVSFDIDANGILNVSAKDKATGKEQSIVIRASSGLADDEIDRMVQDAEAHADEDKRFHALVNARNQADNLAHATRKSLAEMGDKVEAQEKTDIEAAIASLEEALKTDNKDDIEAKTQTLTELAGKLAERVYKQDAAQDAGQGGDQGDQRPKGGAGQGDDVVDAEFEEVNEDNK